MKAHLRLGIIYYCFIFISLFWIHPTHGQKSNRPTLSPQDTVRIVYKSPDWNVDSTAIDTAFLFLRDTKSTKLIQIELQETEPDSSIFAGSFSVSLGQNESIDPEIYIPQQNIKNNESALLSFQNQVQQGLFPRKPAVYHRDEQGTRVIDVYDTREQAAKALATYRKEARLRHQASKYAPNYPSESSLKTAKMAEQQRILTQLSQEARQREQERMRLEQTERQKLLGYQRKFQSLSSAEKSRRQTEANNVFQKGLQLYDAGNYTEASSMFKQSLELYPENLNSYFEYGISLYRLEQYNEALVAINMAPNTKENTLQKIYYKGLMHYRLKELASALSAFREVKSAKDTDLSPSSTFYEGVILFTEEDYTEARSSFEEVIETSNDPRLDEQAEEYIERIARVLQFKKRQEQRFSVMGMFGVVYDSNVLLAPDSIESQGQALDKESSRLLAMGDFEYRPIYERNHEWATKLTALAMVSERDSLAKADPYMLTLSAPYTYKGILWDKGYKLTIKPAYETLYMPIDPQNPGADSSTPKNILNATYLNIDNTFVLRDNWLSAYILDIRNDDSLLAVDSPENNSSALKWTLRTQQSFFLNESKNRAVIGNLGFVTNEARGKERFYSRIDVGVNYIQPAFWETTWTAGISHYQLTFDRATVRRQDKNMTFATGFMKPIKDWFIWSINGNYINNRSNVNTNSYYKYTLMTTAIFNYSF